MLERACGLNRGQLDAIAELEARVVAADGGRLKLEWGSLRSRRGDCVEDLLWWDGDRLLGFLGLYAFGAPTVELAGMVDPSARRRGIGSALVDAAVRLCRERHDHPILLVTPRGSAASEPFARSRGGVLDHSEHAMILTGPPVDVGVGPDVHLRLASSADRARIAELLSDGFGRPVSAEELELDPPGPRTLVIESSGEVVGTMRVEREDGAAAIYGFVVQSARRGRGIGRAALARICREQIADGATRVGLEVAVENEHALGLYTSVGFGQVTTEDYYTLDR